jgi:phage-related protein
MPGPQVTLTFAGDESALTRSFDKVGDASKRMEGSVGSAGKMVGDSSAGFDKANAASEQTYDKFDALESVGRGTSDTMSGLGEIMSGNVLQGSTDLAGGVAALADGFSGALLPAMRGGVTWLKNTTIAQKAMNLAMRANPIGIVVTVLALLVGAFILAYKKSETFRNIVNGALNGVKNVAVAVVGWIKNNFPKILGFMTAPFSLVIKPIIKHKDQILAVVKAIPGAIGKFMSKVGSIISAPFKAAFDGIRNAWNNTVGGKGFSVPGWVPGIGGSSFTIPRFHSGGIVSGAMGSESLAVLRAGEKVSAGSNSGGGGVITIRADGQYAKLLLAMLKEQVRIDGGAKVVFEL